MSSVFDGYVKRGEVFSSIAELCEKVPNLSRVCVGRPLYFDGADYEAESDDPIESDMYGWDREVMNMWEDTREGIAIVGHKYKRVQYPIALSIADPCVESGTYKVLGGDTWNKGERAYVILESDDVIPLGDDDVIKNRIMVSSSHDGSGKILFLMTPYREKTGAAQVIPVKGLAFKHTLNAEERIQKGKQAYSRIESAWQDYSDSAKRMIGVTMSDQDARDFFTGAITNPSGKDTTAIENIRAEVYSLWKGGPGSSNVKTNATLFGCVQAVIEYVDHRQTVRKSGKTREDAAAFDARMIKAGAKRKEKAWMMAKTLLNGKFSSLSGVTEK